MLNIKENLKVGNGFVHEQEWVEGRQQMIGSLLTLVLPVCLTDCAHKRFRDFYHQLSMPVHSTSSCLA